MLILSAPIGEGHDLPARFLAADIRERAPGAEVTIRDGLELFGRPLRALAMNDAPMHSAWGRRLFDLEYWLLARFAPTRRFAGRALYTVAAGRMVAAVEAAAADVVITTYPGFSEVLGRARAAGRLPVPVVSAITDLAALRFWAHPGVDLHLVTHPESIPEVLSIAPASAVLAARGMTSPEFWAPRDRTGARRDLGLPGDGPIVVVSGGGWAVGDLEGAVEAALGLGPDVTVIALCGRNANVRTRLERRFGADARVRVTGFTERMGDLLAAADALVHSTAGLTVFEALARGCPAISYGWGRAHIRLNNRAFARFGLADVARDRPELAAALTRALEKGARPYDSVAELPHAADAVVALAGAPAAA